MLQRQRFLCLFLLAIAACRHQPDPPLKRPAPGDQVSVQLHWSSPWQAGQPVPLFVRLRAEGAPGQASRLVGEFDVPEECKPRLSLVYFKNGANIGTSEDIAMQALC